eukprot:SAG11_NODE_621_length_8169_cov_2.866914_4_plen_81_part_00
MTELFLGRHTARDEHRVVATQRPELLIGTESCETEEQNGISVHSFRRRQLRPDRPAYHAGRFALGRAYSFTLAGSYEIIR